MSDISLGNEHSHSAAVVAKEILITLLQNRAANLRLSTSPSEAAAELGEAYIALYDKVYTKTAY
jgi:hypothetical protein